MRRDIEPLIRQLKNSVATDEFLTGCDGIIEKLECMPDAFDAVEPILRLMEDHEELDFGMPGPLVHFVERFYNQGYEERLVESVRRRPTRHTLWMLNRVINGSEDPAKEDFVRVLDDVLSRTDPGSEAYDSALEFRRLH